VALYPSECSVHVINGGFSYTQSNSLSRWPIVVVLAGNAVAVWFRYEYQPSLFASKSRNRWTSNAFLPRRTAKTQPIAWRSPKMLQNGCVDAGAIRLWQALPHAAYVPSELHNIRSGTATIVCLRRHSHTSIKWIVADWHFLARVRMIAEGFAPIVDVVDLHPSGGHQLCCSL